MMQLNAFASFTRLFLHCCLVLALLAVLSAGWCADEQQPAVPPRLASLVTLDKNTQIEQITAQHYITSRCTEHTMVFTCTNWDGTRRWVHTLPISPGTVEELTSRYVVISQSSRQTWKYVCFNWDGTRRWRRTFHYRVPDAARRCRVEVHSPDFRDLAITYCEMLPEYAHEALMMERLHDGRHMWTALIGGVEGYGYSYALLPHGQVLVCISGGMLELYRAGRVVAKTGLASSTQQTDLSEEKSFDYSLDVDKATGRFWLTAVESSMDALLLVDRPDLACWVSINGNKIILHHATAPMSTMHLLSPAGKDGPLRIDCDKGAWPLPVAPTKMVCNIIGVQVGNQGRSIACFVPKELPNTGPDATPPPHVPGSLRVYERPGVLCAEFPVQIGTALLPDQYPDTNLRGNNDAHRIYLSDNTRFDELQFLSDNTLVITCEGKNGKREIRRYQW